MSSMEEDHHHHHQRELQLLPTPHYSIASSSSSSSRHMNFDYPFEGGPTGLDLQLSISLSRPFRNSPHQVVDHRSTVDSGSSVKALKWHASEQIRLASIEKAYAERVRELTRREIELAQSEFARARHIWEEVDKAERATCMATPEENMITCRSCRQRFRPCSRE